MSRDEASSSDVPRATRRLRVATVVSSYHHELTGTMQSSAAAVLRHAGVADEDLYTYTAPGAFELPLVAQRLAERDELDAVLCFGLVLKGETEHDRYIAEAVAHGLLQIGLATDKPVLFGVLTCSTLEQARRRAKPAAEGGLDKGREVALAALRVLAALDAVERDLPCAEVTP